MNVKIKAFNNNNILVFYPCLKETKPNNTINKIQLIDSTTIK